MRCPNCNTEVKTHRNPVPTVDIIIEIGQEIVLIERKNPPQGWALPGGFVDYGESFEKAASREAKEETTLELYDVKQFRTYSDPGRDERMHTSSTVYIAKAVGTPAAADDAIRIGLFTESNLPELAFDHNKILADYFVHKKLQ